MKIKVTSIWVDDQVEALPINTEILGFQKERDIPLVEGNWLTVVSNEEPGGVELLLEPAKLKPSQIYQKALFDEAYPAAYFQLMITKKSICGLTNCISNSVCNPFKWKQFYLLYLTILVVIKY